MLEGALAGLWVGGAAAAAHGGLRPGSPEGDRVAQGPRQVEAPVEGRRQQGRGARSGWTEGGLREGPEPRAPAARVSGLGWVPRSNR